VPISKLRLRNALPLHAALHAAATLCAAPTHWPTSLHRGFPTLDKPEVKHESRYSDNNLLFTDQVQQVHYLSYPHESMKN
jgi:hypothetical protein